MNLPLRAPVFPDVRLDSGACLVTARCLYVCAAPCLPLTGWVVAKVSGLGHGFDKQSDECYLGKWVLLFICSRECNAAAATKIPCWASPHFTHVMRLPCRVFASTRAMQTPGATCTRCAARTAHAHMLHSA